MIDDSTYDDRDPCLPVFLIERNGNRGAVVQAPKASHPASAATQRVRAT
jgi:hypothetical protein